MGLPEVNITFKSVAASAVKRSERGIIAMLLKDTAGLGNYVITDITEIPAAISADNKKQIELALIGGQFVPKKIIVRVGNEATWTAGLSYLETIKFDYLVIPDAVTADMASIVTWVGNQRTNGKMVKAILPKHAADKEYIINFTTDNIVVGSNTYTAAKYCSRIAGLIAGTPLTVSTTFQPLPEVESCQSYTKAQLDTAIDNGEFVIYHDGEKVKVARGVNSFKTTTADKGEDFKKIKIVDILDIINSDIQTTLEDKYIGKYPNYYDNKVLLITAIKGYYEQLEADGLLDQGKNTVFVDIPAQKVYLESIGTDTTSMNEQEIKEANTRDKVFLKSNIKPLDAIEDITLDITI